MAAIMSILVSPLPLVGLVVAVTAFVLTRKQTDWPHSVAVAFLILACIYNAGLLALLIGAGMRWL